MTFRDSSIHHDDTAYKRWTRFFVGLVLLGLFVTFFASGYAPPGVFGEVLRHNQEHDIDASPLFYTDVENMHELEAGLVQDPERD
jgi:hypothetical protein